MSIYSSRRALAVLGIGLATLHGAPRPLAAQQKHPLPAAVSGVVKDELGKPIPGVEVTALKTGTTVRSDSAGEFTLAGIPAGSIDLSVRRLAFEPILLVVSLSPGDTLDVEVTLSVVAQKLTGMIVLADPVHRRLLDAFESRRKLGIGYFITRADIIKRDPSLLSDMLRMVPGAKLIEGENGRMTLRFARVGALNCPPQFYVDGLQVTGFTIDEMPPGDVEGIEIYAGPGGLPPEYNRLHSTVSCGTVIIWSRIPGTDGAKP